jgi:glycosyltransferase XagB
MQQAPLGETLIAKGLLREEQLQHALYLQKRSGARLGDILVGDGMIGYYALYHAIATHHTLPFINLLEDETDPRLLKAKHMEDYLRHHIFPVRRKGNVLLIAVCDPCKQTQAWINTHYKEPYELAITSPVDIRRGVEQHFGKQLEHQSRDALWHAQPEASARITMYPWQKHCLLLAMLSILAVIITKPLPGVLGLLIFCHVTYAVTMLFKCVVFQAGTKAIEHPSWTSLLLSMDERTLPVYTVLVPMYKEASTLPKMLENMYKLDYPFSKLDIKLVLEADDEETLKAAYALRPSYQFDIVRVPPSEPRTKPKACNYALRFARGEFVTVFDADDCPDPQQLKKAVYTFRHSTPDVACLQARLNYYNFNDNWLTRFFSLEYTILFHFMLYGLQRLGIPIPLGGTSNHIALAKLKKLGEWDPYNVTEDADLGTRLAARGYKTIMLDSFTLEEAPCQTYAWIRQRSRWIKGYMQTWLVHMRHPLRLYRTLGLRGFIGFQFFIGFPGFAFLTAPLIWVLSLLWAGNVMALHSISFPGWLAALTLFNLIFNIVTHWYCSLYCANRYRTGRRQILVAGALYPFYLVLHSIASYKALWQLFVKPHFWEKTTHGLNKNVEAFGLRSKTGDISA